jgi:large subunit ribosomal protein L9
MLLNLAHMKVVLLKDVKGVGKAHEAVSISDGHALNFLIPKRLAIAATQTALKEAELRIKQKHDRKALDTKLISERVTALAENPITIRKKVNEKGHLYDAVDADEIAELAQLPVESITLEKPIKEAGTYQIAVSGAENYGTFTLLVESE